VAFARQVGPHLALAIAPRFTVGLVGFGGPPPLGSLWGDTALKIPAGLAAAPLVDAFTGGRINIAEGSIPLPELLSRFPVALFTPEGPDHGGAT
jgi:maltooligosyltrehalose synthase